MFSDRDVLAANKVCVIGETLKRELFQGESPVGKDIRVNNVSMKVLGVLPRKGANMMGMDQDDILLAPWTTIKYRISGAQMANANQSAAAAANAAGGTQHGGQYAEQSLPRHNRPIRHSIDHPSGRHASTDPLYKCGPNSRQGRIGGGDSTGNGSDYRAAARATSHSLRRL